MTRISSLLSALACGASAVAISFAATSCGGGPKDGVHRLELLTTGDVHGSWFDEPYTGGGQRRSLFAVNYYVDSVRTAAGKDNVILIDAGDCLQGDNAAYYYNYVDTKDEHLFPRLAAYMGYDAVVAGNHDIETGHDVYDRVAKELRKEGIPFLGGNAIRTGNGKPYFPTYKIVKRAGLKVAILGFTNPNMKAWLSEDLWSGITFESLIPLVQEDVDMVREKERPDVVIVAAHSGTGNGNNDILESQGIDLWNTLKGVDFIVCAHDHNPFIINDTTCLIDAGAHCANIGHGVLEVTVKGGQVADRTVSAELIPVDKAKADAVMRERFRKDYEAVKAFSLRPVGEIQREMRTRDAYRGPCDYINLLHSVQLSVPEAQISFAAPLTYDGTIPAGQIVYNDLSTIYPFENQLVVIRMTGKEIVDYLEYSYKFWINTIGDGSTTGFLDLFLALFTGDDNDEHLLDIKESFDGRYGGKRWSFSYRPYNFDSAGGLFYTVDVTELNGARISVQGLANGESFHEDSTYNVAMTSYRFSGGGDILENGAGIAKEDLESRVAARYPAIRDLVGEYIEANSPVTPELIGDRSVIGNWFFIPQELASEKLDTDMALLFGDEDAMAAEAN